MITINVHNGMTIPLGREGENLARKIIFDVSSWQAEYGDGNVSLVANKDGAEPYPCDITVDGSIVTWMITVSDTAQSGLGRCELHYIVGDTLVKSDMWRTYTADALGTPAPEPPEPAKNWVDTVLKSSSDAKQAATESAESARQSAESSVNAANSANEAQKSREAIENMEVSAVSLSPDSAATVEKAIADGKVKLTFGIPKGERDIFWLNTVSDSRIAETFDEILAAYKAGKSIWIRDAHSFSDNVATVQAYLVRPIEDDDGTNIIGMFIICGGSAYGSSEIGAADALMNVTYYIHASPEEVTFEQLISVAAEWQDMSPLIVNITEDGQDESGEPIYKSDKTFDEIKAAYDTGREVKLREIGDLNSEILQAFCGSEPRLFDVSDDEAIFFCVGTATALFNNELNSMSLYGGLPTFFITVIISKTENGDTVEVYTSFTTNSEGQPVFDQEFITKLPSGSNFIFVSKTDEGLECGVDDETLFSMMFNWLEGINDPTKPIPYSPTQLLLLGGGSSIGRVYNLCNVGLLEENGESIVTALFVNAVGTRVSFIQVYYYSNKAHWYYYDFPFDFTLLETDATDNGKFLRVESGKWEKSEFDGSDLSFGINNANVNDFLRVASVTDGVPTSWKVDTIANAKGVNF